MQNKLRESEDEVSADDPDKSGMDQAVGTHEINPQIFRVGFPVSQLGRGPVSILPL